MTKKSCSLPVRGEIFRSERMLKTRKSPTFLEESCSHGLMPPDDIRGRVLWPPSLVSSTRAGDPSLVRSSNRVPGTIDGPVCPIARPSRRFSPPDSQSPPGPGRVARGPLFGSRNDLHAFDSDAFRGLALLAAAAARRRCVADFSENVVALDQFAES